MKFKWTALMLIAICVVVFILQLSTNITDNFALYSSRVLREPWQLVTSMFLHGDFSHLFYNMFALGLFGLILEKINLEIILNQKELELFLIEQ